MAKIYADLICKGRKTIDDVPERIRGEALSILTSKGIIIEE